MSEKEGSGHLLRYKTLYLAIILLIYLLGINIPLYMTDTSAYDITTVMDAQGMLMQTMLGDTDGTSLFALGVSPLMMSSIVIQVIMACRGSDARSKSSPKQMNRITVIFTAIFAVVQAYVQSKDLQFVDGVQNIIFARVVTIIEMVTGSMVVMWLCDRNKKYGIGGQTAIIFVNILTGIMTVIAQHNISQMAMPLVISLVVMIIVFVMEKSEKRIPVQRISIHNIYSDKNYLAIKLNPIGVMPVMFGTGFFMIPQIAVTILNQLMPNNAYVLWLADNLNLTRPFGIAVYIVILYILTIGFSCVFVNPKEITEQLLKNGDSLVDIHAGADTKKYLSQQVRGVSLLSATVMSICLGVPMLMQILTNIDSSLVMFPSSIMMLTGVWSNLYEEIISIKNNDAYKPFI